jgi:hypothetical protein
MPKVDTEKLRSLTRSTARFLEFEREIEDSVRQEYVFRLQEIDDDKRAREKRARKKRLRKLRATQSQ